MTCVKDRPGQTERLIFKKNLTKRQTKNPQSAGRQGEPTAKSCLASKKGFGCKSARSGLPSV